jgi:hypothetical protein
MTGRVQRPDHAVLCASRKCFVLRPISLGTTTTVAANINRRKGQAMKLQKALAVIGAGVLLFAATDAATFAATGSSLVLGKINQANTVTTIQNTGTGNALRLLTKSTATAPLVVNGKGKVVNLYADRAATADNSSKLGGETIAQVRTGINAVTVGGKTVAQIVSSVPHPAGVVWVAKTGGQFTSVSAALASITDNGPAHRYVIKVAPGTYTETGPVVMKSYVDVEGSGQDVTTITCACGSNTYQGTDGSSAVLQVTGPGVHVGIRGLTIANTGSSFTYSTGIVTSTTDPGDVTLDSLTATATGGFNVTGIYNNSSSSPTMTNVTATATGGTINYGIYNNSSLPTMTNLTATATGGTNNWGIYNYSSSPTMSNLTATATGGNNTYGIYNDVSSPTMTNVTATATGATNTYGIHNNSSSTTMTNVTATATGGTNNWGIYDDVSSPTMTNVTATATGGTSNNFGIYNNGSSPTMTGGRAIGSGGSGTNTGIWNSSGAPIYDTVTASGKGGTQGRGIVNGASATVTLVNVTATGSGGNTNQDWGIDNHSSSSMTVRDSFITGAPNSILNNGSTVQVANSRLSAAASGTMTCIGTYDASTFVALNASCQ